MKSPLGSRVGIGPQSQPSLSGLGSGELRTEGVDAFLSRLVMGFIDRRVSPQTIADVVLAQVYEEGLSGDELQAATCNGIMESLASAPAVNGLQEIMLLVARRKGFPSFLSPTATLGSLAALLLNPLLSLDASDPSYPEKLRIIDSLSKQSVEILGRSSSGPAFKALKMRLTNALKTAHQLVSSIGPVCPHLLILRQVLLKGVTPGPEMLTQATFASIRAVVTAIANTPDHVLVHHRAGEYITADVQREPIRKLDSQVEVLAALEGKGFALSRFQASFLVEWLFSGCLESAAKRSADGATFVQAMRSLLSQSALRLDGLKGLVRALQRDLSQIYATQAGRPAGATFLELAQRTAGMLFGALYRPGQSIWPLLSQDFVPWALQLACHPAESRLVTREHVEWLRSLDTREWMEGLGQPPQWVLSGASENAAVVFQMAPGGWLGWHAAHFFEALHQESVQSEFVVSGAHYDFVEFLIRSLRKKSPLFASEVETLIALQILGRSEHAEQNQIRLALTRLRMTAAMNPLERERTQAVLSLLTQTHTVERLGPNPVARALALMARCSRSVQVKSRHHAAAPGRF